MPAAQARRLCCWAEARLRGAGLAGGAWWWAGWAHSCWAVAPPRPWSLRACAGLTVTRCGLIQGDPGGQGTPGYAPLCTGPGWHRDPSPGCYCDWSWKFQTLPEPTHSCAPRGWRFPWKPSQDTQTLANGDTGTRWLSCHTYGKSHACIYRRVYVYTGPRRSVMKHL